MSPLSAPPSRFRRIPEIEGARRDEWDTRQRLYEDAAMFLRYHLLHFYFLFNFFVLNTGVGGVGDSGRTRARTTRERGISHPLRSHVDLYVGRKTSEAVAGEMTTSREQG